MEMETTTETMPSVSTTITIRAMKVEIQVRDPHKSNNGLDYSQSTEYDTLYDNDIYQNWLTGNQILQIYIYIYIYKL